MVELGSLRYWCVSLASGLLALGGVLKIDTPEFWAGVAAIYGIAIADQIKHRNE